MSRPIALSLVFSLTDVVWLITLYVSGWGRSTGKINFPSTLWKIGDLIMHYWNEVHFPIRFFIEPIILPISTAHPLSVPLWLILFYQVLCVFQSTLVGYILGVIIQYLKLPTK